MGDIFNPDFRDFIQALNDAEVAYLLVGGYAVILHGRARTTGDMDVWVRPDAENHRRLMRAFCSFGLPAQQVPLSLFLNTADQDVFSFGRAPVAIDIMTQVKGLDFDSCASEAIVFEDNELEIRTIRREHLITAKKAAGAIRISMIWSIWNKMVSDQRMPPLLYWYTIPFLNTAV